MTVHGTRCYVSLLAKHTYTEKEREEERVCVWVGFAIMQLVIATTIFSRAGGLTDMVLATFPFLSFPLGRLWTQRLV